MSNVVLDHHVQGLTEGVRSFADELQQAGHTVHTPVEQVGSMHVVHRLLQLVSERTHSLGQPLDVVVQHDVAHLRSSSGGIDPFSWNIPP